ncbi:MAG: aa3-type cytochrome oxidase subunit IV [Candidatus Limnocylindrales bacterium]
MLEQIWNGFLDLTSQLVIPDWGKLVALALPVGTTVLVVLLMGRTVLQVVTVPAARRGKQRITPATPAGVHMPGPSFAPIFAAIGAFLLFVGLVFGGIALILGAVALVLTLLYWLAEGLRIYDHDIAPTATVLPAVQHAGPPPGVHVPGPSWRPIVGALGTALLFLGLVFGEWLLAVGVIALVLGLVGWLPDARKEYGKTVEADQTGHLENIPAPRVPTRLLTFLAILVVGAVVLQSGVFADKSATGATAGGSAAPAPGTGGSAAPGGSAPAGSGGQTADVTVEAKGIAFTQTSWTGPANKPFTIAFSNQDPGTPHNIEIKDSTGAVVFKGDIFSGVDTKTYQVPALPAGDYTFACSVHPNMTGTAKLQ